MKKNIFLGQPHKGRGAASAREERRKEAVLKKKEALEKKMMREDTEVTVSDAQRWINYADYLKETSTPRRVEVTYSDNRGSGERIVKAMGGHTEKAPDPFNSGGLIKNPNIGRFLEGIDPSIGEEMGEEMDEELDSLVGSGLEEYIASLTTKKKDLFSPAEIRTILNDLGISKSEFDRFLSKLRPLGVDNLFYYEKGAIIDIIKHII